MWLASTFSGSLGRLHYHLGSRTSALSTCVKLWDYESEGFLSGQDRALVLNFGGVCFQRGHICTIAEAAANRFFPPDPDPDLQSQSRSNFGDHLPVVSKCILAGLARSTRI